MAIGGASNETVERWLLDATQYKGEIKSLAKEIRDQNKLAGDAALIQSKMAGSMETTAKATAGMRGSMIAANLATAALTRGFSLLTRHVGDAWRVMTNWEDHIGDNVATVNAMSDATAGLISKLEAARTASLLGAEGFKLSADQLAALSKAAIVHARINKQDFVPSLKALTDVVTGGRDKALRELGIDIELAGSKSEKAAQAVGLLVEKFGDMQIVASNTNEKVAQLGNVVEDSWGEMSSAITKTQWWSDLLVGLKDTSDLASTSIKALSGNIASISTARASGMLDVMRAFGLWKVSKEDTASFLAQSAEAQRQGADFGPTMGELTAGTSTPVGQRRKASKPGGTAGRSATGGEFGGALGGALGGAMAGGLFGGASPDMGLADEMAGLQLEQQKLQVADELRIIQEDGAIRMARQNALQQESNRLIKKAGADQAALNQQSAAYDAQLRGLAEGGLAQFGAGMWAAIDAAVQGKISFGEAMASLAKSVLMSVAAQATGEAVLETGRGFASLAAAYFNPALAGKAALHFTAAGVFAGIGGVAGLAGVAVGAAMGGGPSASSSGDARGAGFSSGDRMGGTSSFGERRRDEAPQPIILEVYMGDRSNRAAAMQLEKQLTARIKKAS